MVLQLLVVMALSLTLVSAAAPGAPRAQLRSARSGVVGAVTLRRRREADHDRLGRDRVSDEQWRSLIGELRDLEDLDWNA